MSIQQQINQIIEARRQRLPELRRKQDALRRMEEQIDRLEYTRSQMISPDGQVIRDGKYSELIAQNPEMEWNLQGLDTRGARSALKAAEAELEKCQRRFERDSISISVVGEARIGKSSLLKAISGLNDYVIPAFKSTDCTGAPSVIFNRTGQGLTARIGFKSKRQMMDMAQIYLDKLLPDPENRIILGGMEDIRRLDLERVEKLVPVGNSQRSKLRYLRGMVESYDEWSVYAGRTDILELTDEREIATFVAQNNGEEVNSPKRVNYYRYLAVDRCEISCQFPMADAASINLVDTVGLDDNSEGIEDSMLRVVSEESDAVVFMIRPQSGVAYGLPRHVLAIYQLIEEHCRDRDLSKWLFYFINHIEQAGEHVARNTEYCNAASMTLKEYKYHGWEHQYIVNATDPNAVRDRFLTPMLNELAKNLDALDAAFTAKAGEALKALQFEYNLLCARAQKVLHSDINRNASLMPLVNSLTDESRKQLRGELFRLMQAWYTRKNQPCAEIYQCAEDVLKRMTQYFQKNCYIPPKAEIQARLESGEQPPQVFIDCENRIRNAVSKDFLAVDVELRQFIDRMKDDVARVLCEDCGLGAILKRDPDRPMREWLGDFATAVLDEDAYPTLRLAFDTLCQFDFSVKGFLSFEVRDALNTLDPSHSNTPVLAEANGNYGRTANGIHANLLQRMTIISGELKKRLEVLSTKPNMACFAEINDFYDRLIYAEGVDLEWRTFYAEKSGVLWADRIKKVQDAGVLCKDWMDLVDALAQWNIASCFTISD